MYGMIHTAAREMVIRDLGTDTWEQIKKQHNFVEADFISGNVYSDETTLRLISAIADTVKTPIPDLLLSFGRFWIEHTSQSSYSAIYQMYGDDIISFTQNLNRMHEAIEATLPEADTPVFECLSVTTNQMDVLYSTNREGLETFVTGLFEGLLKHYGHEGTVTHTSTVDAGAVFRITVN